MTTINRPSLIRYQSTANLFKQCPDNIIDLIFQSGTINNFSKNALIYEQSENIFILLKGMVKICKTSHNQLTMIKDVIYPGSFFGECSFFELNPVDESAYSIHPDTVVLTLPKQTFRTLCFKHADMITLVLQELGKKLIQKEKKLASFHFNDAKSRILLFIKEMALNIGVQIGYETLIKHTFTQQDIANITGTSRQTVTFVFNDLKKQNIIHFDRRRILIRDIDLLV